jgi:hypothetical protein
MGEGSQKIVTIREVIRSFDLARIFAKDLNTYCERDRWGGA